MKESNEEERKEKRRRKREEKKDQRRGHLRSFYIGRRRKETKRRWVRIDVFTYSCMRSARILHEFSCIYLCLDYNPACILNL